MKNPIEESQHQLFTIAFVISIYYKQEPSLNPHFLNWAKSDIDSCNHMFYEICG